MNLMAMLTGVADEHPEAIAVIDTDGDRESVVTFDTLVSRSLGVASALGDLGIGTGDCIAVWLPNWSAALCWQFGAAAVGAHVIGINTRYNTAEVAHVLSMAQPKLVVIAEEFHALPLRDILHGAVGVAGVPPMPVAVVSGPIASPGTDLSSFDVGAGALRIADRPADYADIANEPDQLAVAFTTSGSTGKPKLAAHLGSAVAIHARADAARLDLRSGDRMLCALPLSGVFGYSSALAAVAAGATCVMEPTFDPARVLRRMQAWRVSHVVGGDDLVSRLADEWRADTHDLSALRWIGIADFLGRTTELAQWAESEFGAVVTGVYGSSEVFALAFSWPATTEPETRWRGGGLAVSDRIEYRIVDVETGIEATPVGEGELQLRGYNVVDAYLGDPGQRERAFTADGWFRTGDLARRHASGDGIQYICRIGDVLRLRGFLVDPTEIEQRLAAHPGVITAKVVGVRGSDGQTEAVGFVVADDHHTVTSDSLRTWCGEALAKFKVPSVVHVIDEMPTTSGVNGEKIRAVELRRLAQQLVEQAQPEAVPR